MFPREIIDDRTRNTNTTAVRSPANEGCEASKGEEERFEPHNTSPGDARQPSLFNRNRALLIYCLPPASCVVFLLDSARGFRPSVATLATRFQLTR